MEILTLSLVLMGLTFSATASADGGQSAIHSSSKVALIDQPSPENSDDLVPGLYEKRYARAGNLRDYTPKKRGIRPFSRYGPPRHPSISGKRPQPTNEFHSWSHQPRKQPNDPPATGRIPPLSKNNEPHRNAKLEVPSPIRDVDFRDDDPIASQNNEPFQHNVANYLPPKNQKLPNLSSFHVFQRPGPTHLPDSQRYTIHMPALKSEKIKHHHSEISDATFFLMKNAEALSKLYDAPVTNWNYPPFENHQNPNGDRSLKPFENLQNFPQKSKTTSQTANVISLINNLPPSQRYNLPNAVSKNKNIQNDHSQILDAAFFSMKNTEALSNFYQDGQNPGGIVPTKSSQAFRNFAEKTKTTPQTPNVVSLIHPLQSSKLTKLCSEDHQNALKPAKLTHKELVFSPNDWNGLLGVGVSNYPSPSDISLPSISAASTISSGHVLDLRPQGNPTVFPYPEYSGIVPLITHIPSYGTTVGAGISRTTASTGDSLPTHFGLPLPTMAGGRGQATPTASTGVSGAFRPLHYPGAIPIQSPGPIQPVFSIIPSVNSIQHSAFPGLPGYGVQPVAVN